MLYQQAGTEPAAAMLLSKVVQFKSLSHVLYATEAGGAGDIGAQQSFLAALLGPELEAAAMSAARQGR